MSQMDIEYRNVRRALIDKLHTSDGNFITNNIKKINLSKSVLDGNFIELTHFIKEYEVNDEIYSDGRLNREYKNEIVRLLQNYVASDYSYSEHVLRVVKKLGDEELLSTFLKKRDEIRQDENVSFVRDLRRYSQHCGIIRQSTRIQLTRVDNKEPLYHSVISVELTKANLVEWKDWKSKSKAFIRNMEDRIKLIIPLARQLKEINEFHKWIMSEIKTRFEKQIKDYHQILDEIIQLREHRKEKRSRKTKTHVKHLGGHKWTIIEEEI